MGGQGGGNGRDRKKNSTEGREASTRESSRSEASWQAEAGCFVSKQGAP